MAHCDFEDYMELVENITADMASHITIREDLRVVEALLDTLLRVIRSKAKTDADEIAKLNAFIDLSRACRKCKTMKNAEMAGPVDEYLDHLQNKRPRLDEAEEEP